ncbi:MAG: iron uptake system protein EfeO [Acidimicrobiales bacterium]
MALSACGSSGAETSPSTTVAGPQEVAVSLTDQGCDPAHLTVAAGPVTFDITNASSSRSEFEVRTSKPSIIGETEGIAAGSTGTLELDLRDGTYDLSCGTGDVYEDALVVGTGVDQQATGTTVEGVADIAAAVTAYTAYVDTQLTDLVTTTQALSTAVAAGDIEQAKAAHGASRLPYERLEPIAELFPDLDGSMDAREDDFPDGVDDPTFTGWHRIEHLLYQKGDVAAAAPFAAGLAADAVELQTQIHAIAIDPATMTNGAAGLIEEAAATKITGEEDRYSQLSLIDLAANVEGAEKIVELLSPMIGQADPALLQAIDDDFTSFETGLAAYRSGEAYLPYDQLTEADRDRLKASLAALSEDLSQVPGTLGIEVN